MQKLLPAPYGLGSKSVHVSLRAPNNRYAEVREIAEYLGCPKFVGVKVADCIRASGRYDCLLTPEVDINDLKNLMSDIDGEAVTQDMNEFQFANSHPSLSRAVMTKYGHWDLEFTNDFKLTLKFNIDYAAAAREFKIAI